MSNRERKDAIIAAAVTFGVALLIIIFLFVKSLNYDREAFAEASIPEYQDEEEYFLEPDLLIMGQTGETDLEQTEEAEPQPPGEPDPAETEQLVKTTPNNEEPKEEPVSTKPKLVSSTEQSDVKTSTPKPSDEDQKRIASIQGKFKSDNNGSRTGKESANSGSGGNGVSVSGSVNGRKQVSISTWPVKLTQKTTVKVSIIVDADGNVTSATAISGGTPTLRSECEKMARTSKWTKKAGAAPQSGTISITITPV